MRKQLCGWWLSRLWVERWAIVLWAVALVVIGARLWVLGPGERTLFPVYQTGGRNWVQGADLYPTEVLGAGHGLYRYSPAVAVGFVPFSPLPQKVADSLWRAILVAALLCGALGMARAVGIVASRRPLGRGRAALLLLLLLPAAAYLGNGQANAMVIGLVLGAFAAAGKRRWNVAAVCMACAALLKVYPIAAGLLLAVLHPRRFGLRFLLALAVGLALPFACQEPAYVLRQYQLWFRYAAREDRSGWSLECTNIDLQLLFRVWATPIPLHAYRLIEVAAGLAFAAICWVARARRSEQRSLTLALGLGCTWMTVLGPASEAATYLILLPCVALGVLSTWGRRAEGPDEPHELSVVPCESCLEGTVSRRPRIVPPLVRGLMLASYALFFSVQLMGCVGPWYSPYRLLGPQPIAGLVFLAGLLLQTWGEAPAVARREAPPASRIQDGVREGRKRTA